MCAKMCVNAKGLCQQKQAVMQVPEGALTHGGARAHTPTRCHTHTVSFHHPLLRLLRPAVTLLNPIKQTFGSSSAR